MSKISFIDDKGFNMPKSKERCQEIRDEMRNMILQKSMLYFAKNGFAGTKISDLSRNIGIAQGSIYVYFESKEELFQEILRIADCEQEVKQLKLLIHSPLSAKAKLRLLSDSIMSKLKTDEMFAAKIALNTQMMLEESKDFAAADTYYQSELYSCTARIIEQGQIEGTMVTGSSMKLADYYWGVVYLYALKSLFTTRYEMITTDDLERTVVK
jgi:AcrR family transcriptional regulator